MTEQMRQAMERDVRAWVRDEGIGVELGGEPGYLVLSAGDTERLRAAVALLVGLGCTDEGMAGCDAGPPPVFRRLVRVTSHPGGRRPGLGVPPG